MRWSAAGRRGRIGRLAAAAVAAALLAGCGGGESAADRRQDQQFVNAVTSAAPDVSHYRSPTQLIRLGKAACADFDSGVSYQQLADRLKLTEGSNPLPVEDLGAVITSAVDTYCPKYEALVS